MHRNWKQLGLTCLGLMVFSQIATAHVTVSPREAAAGSTTTYAIRVPTETSSPTVRVEVTFPEGITVSRFEPNPGWEATLETNAQGRIVRSVISGGSIAPRESATFSFTVSNPSAAGDLTWTIRQAYADGNSSDWTPLTTITGN